MLTHVTPALKYCTYIQLFFMSEIFLISFFKLYTAPFDNQSL